MKILSFLLLAFVTSGPWSSGIKNACKYALDEKPTVRIDDHLQGVWKMNEDTDANNYFIIEKDGDYEYSITYMNRGGDNRGLKHWGLSFSEVNNVKFINLPNWDQDYPGFLFLKINSISTGGWYMTGSLVSDPSVRNLTSSAELRRLLEKNLNNSSFYGKELHFYKKFEFNSFH